MKAYRLTVDVEEGDLGDWRFASVTRLTQHVPAAFPGGPLHKAGAPVRSAIQTRGPDGRPMGFIAPSVPAMALNVAMSAGRKAGALRNRVQFQPMVTPDGPGTGALEHHSPILLDYFEQAMVAVTFAFQAIESFANLEISRLVSDTHSVRRKKKVLVNLTADEIQRQVSTDEKVATILPELLKVRGPKGTVVWEDYKKLKTARDSTIHMKGRDQYPHRKGAEPLDSSSLFYHFLNEDPDQYAVAAYETITFFFQKREKPRWLASLRGE